MHFQKIILVAIATLFIVQIHSFAQAKKVFVFSKTEGYRHKSIESGVKAIQKLGKEHQFAVTHSEDATDFNETNLQHYDAVVFLSTTGNILNTEQEASFEKYIQKGGGFVGIHAAADTEYEWAWYGKLVGAYFKSHPEQQQASIKLSDHKHPATEGLPNPWSHYDEWYNYKNISMSLTVLATLDESSYKGGENGAYHPISWIQKYDGGKMFYTGLGHTIEAYSDTHFLSHLWGGIQYIITD